MMRFNFVIPIPSGISLAELGKADLDRDWRLFQEGPYNWSLQTFLALRDTGVLVTLSDRFLDNAVNLAHPLSIRPFCTSANALLVSLQADYPHSYCAHLHVVQNQSQIAAGKYWIPHWPQPALRPRDGARCRVETVAYAGQPYYLAGGVERWRTALAARGLRFATLDRNCWNDYSQADILLAIRSFDGYPYNKKPPTKLINAWHARAPLIGGADSAFRQIGTPNEDYLMATSFEEALMQIDRLRENHDFYDRIVTNGVRKAAQYTHEQIAKNWVTFLLEVAEPALHRLGEVRSGSRPEWLLKNSTEACRGVARTMRNRLLGTPKFSR